MHLSRLTPIALAIAGFLLLSTSLRSQVFFPLTTTDLINDITTSNTNCESDIIYLGGLTFTLTAVNNTGANGANGLPVILADTCSGVSYTLTIQGGNITRSSSATAFRIIEVSSGASLSLDAVIISNGNA